MAKETLTVITRPDGLLQANRKRLQADPSRYDSTAVDIFQAHSTILDFLEEQLVEQTLTSEQLAMKLSQWPEFAQQHIDPEVLFLFTNMTVSKDGKFIFCGPGLPDNFIVASIRKLANSDSNH